ncbi:MAG TPA: PEP-CTERM sorting domain-containing protein, partial [Bryobacteraceae bacterium]|nr:PEP-CTERM sorting domain-containing protein [Bryobacteraceae bacterium]
PIEINIPSDSTFDLNPVLPASAPEPGTIGLTGGAVLALIFYRKRARSTDCGTHLSLTKV